MLIINDDVINVWHVGEDMDYPEGYMVKFEASGHELEFIMKALAGAGVEFL